MFFGKWLEQRRIRKEEKRIEEENNKVWNIYFHKSAFNYKSGENFWDYSWQEPSDNSILTAVYDLTDVYPDITVEFVDLKNSAKQSTVTIRCSKENRNKYVRKLIELLDYRIKNITFEKSKYDY